MRIGITTSSHGRLLRSPEIHFTCEQSMEAFRQGGFDVVCMDFYEYCEPGQPMRDAGWEDWCFRQKEAADRIGVEVLYAHAPFYDEHAKKTDGDGLYEELVRRSVRGAGIMGAKQMVFHPCSVSDGAWYSRRESLERNAGQYRRYAEMCAGYGITVCMENMIEPSVGRRFGSSAEELLELYDLLGKGYGICWDFGHAHMSGVRQCAALEQLGSRLTMLHVNDNFGKADSHLTPYFGTIRWDEIMKTLQKTGYRGDLLFENFGFFDGLPEQLRVPALSFCHRLGEYMVGLKEAETEAVPGRDTGETRKA